MAASRSLRGQARKNRIEQQQQQNVSPVEQAARGHAHVARVEVPVVAVGEQLALERAERLVVERRLLNVLAHRHADHRREHDEIPGGAPVGLLVQFCCHRRLPFGSSALSSPLLVLWRGIPPRPLGSPPVLCVGHARTGEKAAATTKTANNNNNNNNNSNDHGNNNSSNSKPQARRAADERTP
jgi:hypothetical protein